MRLSTVLLLFLHHYVAHSLPPGANHDTFLPMPPGPPPPPILPVMPGRPSRFNQPPFLNDLARRAGKLWFGTASSIPQVTAYGPEQDDEAYMAVRNDTRIWGQATPTGIMKVLHPDS